MPNVFRWNVARREQLGRLVTGGPVEGFPAVLEEVRRCTAHVLAMAGDSRLIFVGRSPENLYDYLSGAFAETSRLGRLGLLHLSLRSSYNSWAAMSTQTRTAMREQFGALGLDPATIMAGPHATALIDVIYEGETFGRLLELLNGWAADHGIDGRVLRRRLRIVGIVTRGSGGYTNRGWKRLEWARTFRPSALKGVSVPRWFWSHLGNSEQKVSRPNPQSAWCDPTMTQPPRDAAHADGLRLARALYEAGRSREERDALAAALAEMPAMRHVWCRVIAAELRAASRPKRVERAFGSKQRVRSWRRHVDRRSPLPRR